MMIAITFSRQAENECNHDKGDRPFFLESENKEFVTDEFDGIVPLFFHALGGGNRRELGYRPNGVVTSVPAGGLNSKVEAGIGARDSFE